MANPTYSLWRNGTLLGRFVERTPMTHHDVVVGAAGVLELMVASSNLTPMFQTSIAILPGAPIFQHPIEPMVVGKEPSPRKGQRGPQELEPLSAEEARGVPKEQILEIRDENDRVIDTSMIVLHLFVIPDDVDARAEMRKQGLPEDTREVWNISFATQRLTDTRP